MCALHVSMSFKYQIQKAIAKRMMLYEECCLVCV